MEKKSIAIAAVYAGLAALMPQGKIERIVGYYNPDTDKQQGRNETCKCGSGLKFKKCHGAPSHDLAIPIDGKEVEGE